MDTGEHIAISVIDDNLTTHNRKLQARVESLEASLKLVAQRYHDKNHNGFATWDICNMTFCREVFSILDYNGSN